MGRLAIITRCVVIASTILASYFFPYYVSLPRWTSGEWAFFPILSFSLPVLIVIFFIVLLPSRHKTTLLCRALVVLYIVYAIAFTYFAYALYHEWSQDPLGRYFLPPKSDHYMNVLLRFGRPYIEAFCTGLVFTCIFWLLQKFSNRRFFKAYDLWLLFFMGSVLSFERTIIAIFIAFVVMIGISLWYTLHKAARPIRVFLPLMIGCWISLFWGDIIAYFLFRT